MRILMLGNSFTSTNQLPERLAQRTGAEVAAHTRGGARLAEQLNPNTRLGARTLAALRESHWDYVFLQEMSNGPITAPEKFRDSVRRLSQLLRAHGAEPVLYATWAYENPERLSALGLTREEMYQAMHRACCAAAAENRLRMADVGTRFQLHADEGLFGPDGVHPNLRGTELAVETLAAALR